MKIFIFITLLVLIATNAQAQSLTEQIANKKSAGAKKSPKDVKTEFARAIKELRASGIEKKAIQKGVKAPFFHIAGKPIWETLKDGPIVLKFFRGTWCPYCMLELKAYQKHYKDIQKKGYQLIFLTPDSAKEIQKTIKKNGFSFPMYTDVENAVAKKFGIAFKLDKKVNELYKKFGIDLQRSQDNNNSELPMPGTYVIQKDGKISFAFADADYTKRVDPIELLKKL